MKLELRRQIFLIFYSVGRWCSHLLRTALPAVLQVSGRVPPGYLFNQTGIRHREDRKL